MNNRHIAIRFIAFLGEDKPMAIVRFEDGVNLIYGASNTGKSFLLKTIDFMFGGTDPLPSISEREGYETVLLGIVLNGSKEFTLSRSISGGGYKLFASLVTETSRAEPIAELAETAASKKVVSLSQFLLDELGFAGRRLAKNASGETDGISIRDFASFFLVDETTILSEKSPVEGDLGRLGQTKDRSFFRLLLSGKDDGSIVPITDAKTFNANRSIRADVVRELIATVELELKSKHPDSAEYAEQLERLNATLSESQNQYETREINYRTALKQKTAQEQELRTVLSLRDACEVHLDRFRKLDSVYSSDIARLKAIEEIGFVLGRRSLLECELCGASPESQVHNKSLEEIQRSRAAADSEIRKVQLLQSELTKTIQAIMIDAQAHLESHDKLIFEMQETDRKILSLKADLQDISSQLAGLLKVRDRVLEGLALQRQKSLLLQKLVEVEQQKNESLKDKPLLKIEDPTIHQFCITMSEVLQEWGFPGKNQVSFDEKKFDVRIDGKLRTDNGKGVRAVTHSAFKVAQLVFSIRHSLPHPGLLVLDSPLVTYRDPLKDKKNGALADDEKALATTSLKSKFFEHLASLSKFGQFIVLENVDPPEGIERFASVQAFSGDISFGRFGLFEVQSSNI